MLVLLSIYGMYINSASSHSKNSIVTQQYLSERVNFFKIVTSDETWVHHTIPKSKHSSTKQRYHVVMFRHAKGVTYVYFLDMDYKFTAGYYSMLMKTFRLALRKNQLIYFIHDDPPHVKLKCDRIFFPILI